MRYALLCYDSDAVVGAWTSQQEEEVFAKHAQVETELAAQGRLGANLSLMPAVAVAKVHGPAAALGLIEPLADRLSSYFNYHGVKGALLAQLGLADEARVAFNRARSR